MSTNILISGNYNNSDLILESEFASITHTPSVSELIIEYISEIQNYINNQISTYLTTNATA